ncbi:hypothetical protein ACFU93_21190 [Streptomyces sp. NPDC057611]|uniref:hypothetical protein n=1 Tax=Streptomyces sp. NPDC057611 TaxID=3346182 RepID=UPI0036C6D5DA
MVNAVLLLRRSGPGDLADLPLALEQAAAWRAETGMPVSEYLRLFDQKRLSTLAARLPRRSRRRCTGCGAVRRAPGRTPRFLAAPVGAAGAGGRGPAKAPGSHRAQPTVSEA